MQIIHTEDVPEPLSGSVYSWKVSLHIPGLNLILCGDKKQFPSKSHISYFFLRFFFPQMIWQFQPSLANCWKQMYFGLEQGWRWDTAPFSANSFAPDSHPSATAHCPGLPWHVCLQGFEAGVIRRGCTRRKKCTAGGPVVVPGALSSGAVECVISTPCPPICLYTRPFFPGG